MPQYPTLSLFPLTNGIHLGIPPHRLPPGFSPRAQNLRMRDSIISKRPGLADFNGTTGLGTASSAITGLFEYRRETGTVETVALTGGPAVADRKVYRSASGVWSDITDATLFDALGSDDIQGGTLEPYDSAVVPNASQIDVLYLANGAGGGAELLKWIGSGNAVSMQTSPGAPRYLATFANRLIIGHVLVGGTIRGSRIGWSADGDAETWTGVSSGQVDLVETADEITRLLVLRGRLVIYKSRSIFLARETGLSAIPLAFSLISKDIGAIASFSVAAAGDRHFFLGQDNVYTFDGTFPSPIGDPIRRDLKNINPSRLRQVFSMVDEQNSEYWLFVPEGSENNPAHAWVFNYVEGSWNRWEFPTLVATSRAAAGGATLWSDLSTTKWSDLMTTTWAQLGQSGEPTLIVGRSDRTTDEINTRFLSDGTAAIDAFWESKDEDFNGQPGSEEGAVLTTRHSKTLVRVSVRTRGTGSSSSLTCTVSLDGGLSFQDAFPKPATVLAGGGVVNFDLWKTSDRFRVRLRNNTAAQTLPGIEELVLHYLPRDL